MSSKLGTQVSKPNPSNDRYSDREIAERRDAVIQLMLTTPPNPHSKMKIGKRKTRVCNRSLLKLPPQPRKADDT
jgi:hypothetical protein